MRTHTDRRFHLGQGRAFFLKKGCTPCGVGARAGWGVVHPQREGAGLGWVVPLHTHWHRRLQGDENSRIWLGW